MATEQIEEVLTGDPKPKPELAEEHRTKLDSIVQQMVKNKESDSAIQMVVNDFKQKYSATPASRQPKPEPQQPAFQIQLSEPTLRAIPATTLTQPSAPNEQINIPKEQVTYIPDQKTLEIQKQSGKAKVAHEKVNAALASNDTQYEKKLRESRRDSYTIESLRNEYKQKGQILPPQDEQGLLQKEKERQYNLPVTSEQLSDFKTGTILTPNLSRKFIKDLNDKDVSESAYRVDKFNELANDPDPYAHKRIEKINEIAKGIKKGTYVYDPETKTVVQPIGLIGSLIEGTKNKFKADEEHDFLKNTSNDAAIIMELEDERNNPNMDDPIRVPKGKVGEVLKSVAEMPLKPIVAGVAGTIGGTFIGNPELGTVAATALGAYENRKAQYGATFKQVYNELRDQGKPTFDALAEARKQAENAQEIGTIVGGAQGLIGAKIGAIPIKGTNFNVGFQQAIGDFLKKNGSEFGKIALDAVAQGGLAASGEVVKNKLAQSAGIKRDLDSGTADAFWGNVFMSGGIGAALKLGRGISNVNYKRILSGLTKNIPEETINAALQEKVTSGEITQQAADQALQEINKYKEKDSQIPPNVTEEARFKIQDNIDKINQLEQQKEATHKSLQGPIKERIDKLVEENLALSKETEKPVKSETGLPKAKEKEAIDFAHELVDEGLLPDAYGDEVKKDPIKFWQTVAQQAQNRDENWKPLSQPLGEQSVRDNYGDTIVDYAKELFPAPEITETPSSISVIQPGEIKHPETITIKPNEAANEIKPTEKPVIEKPDFDKAKEGDKVIWNEYGNDTHKEWTVGKKVTRRNGEQGIELIRHISSGESGVMSRDRIHILSIEDFNNQVKNNKDAIPIGSSEEVHVGETPGNSQEVGAGIPEPGETSGAQEGQPTQEESKDTGKEGVAPPMPPSEGKGIYVEQPATQLSFRGLQEVANEFGYEDVKSRDRVSDIQERKNAEVTANEWAQNGEYQKNVDDLLDRIERREHVPTAKQRLILEQYLANERQKAREMPKNSAEYDRQLLKLQRIKDIGQIARQEAGAALRLPDQGTLPHPITDESSAMIAKMEANSVDKLTDQQKAEVEAQVAKYKQASDEANSKIAALEEQVSKLDAQKEFNKAKSTTKRTKKTAEERVAFRRSEIEAAREALRKLRSGESGLLAVPLPGVRELMAIAPHVKNIMVDLVAQGVDNLQDVISHLHTEFKDVLDGLTEKNIHDIIAGEYNEKGKTLSELRRQIKDIQDEAKYINQLESLLNGKEPKAEKAKVERNQKIKALKEKIKSFKQGEKEANRFYGESDAGERKLDKLRDELERIQNRRDREKPVNGSDGDAEISAREQEIRGQIKEAQAEWDREKELARNAKSDYKRIESERNRQIEKVTNLKEKLSELEKGNKPASKSSTKKTDTPEIETLKKQVTDAEKELNKTIATEKRIKGLEEELERLQQRRDKEPKEVNKREVTEREKELKEQIEAERAAFKKEESEANKFYKEEIDEDAKKLIAIKKRNQKLEQTIKEKIAKGKFDKEIKRSIFDREDIKKNYPRLRKDALDAIAKKEEAQHEFDLALFNDEMGRRSGVAKAADFIGKLIHTSKAVMSGIDDSATFVQNGLVMLANPKIGAKAWLRHWKDAFNDARFKRELSALHQRPDWEVIKNSGLDIVEPHSAASKQVEEAFEQNLLAGKIKIKGEEYQPWKYTGGIFERAFTSMGNNMRLLLFEKQMAALKEAKKTFESHPEEYKAAARAINELTGRGQLPAGIAQASPYITPFIWAPRMLTSTINTLGLSDLVLGIKGKGYYQNLTPMQRRFALGQLGRGVGIGVAVMVAAALGGAKVDYDPRSVTFGDVIIGDHHYNVFGRYVPVIKTLVQAVGGTRIKGSGQEQDLDSGKFGAKTRLGVVGGFFRGKTTPFVGSMMNLAEGRNYFTNEEFGVKDLPEALIQPMSIKELREGWENDGTMTLLNRFLPAFEGLKTSDERDFNKSSGGSTGGAGAIGRTVSRERPTRVTRTNPHNKN